MLLPRGKRDEIVREAFWRWVHLLAAGDFRAAVGAVRWPEGRAFSPVELRDRIGRFFNDEQLMVPIVPNERLVEMIDDKMEIEWSEEGDEEQEGWMMALLPVSPEPERAKEDDVSLMGIAISFFLVAEGDHQVLEFETLHV